MYRNGHVWTQDGTDLHGGASSQQIKVKDQVSAQSGLYQQIDAGVGDAVTVEVWVNAVANNAYTGMRLGVQEEVLRIVNTAQDRPTPASTPPTVDSLSA
ncbi:MAG: hypothetical protein HY718_20180 [Planctomycetes bacterium]|nr:hypothetical protein [Planctomycetota bacterium]